MAFHYGQAIFEGMKATVDSNGTPILFRPEANAKRLNFSALRLGMPKFPESLFVEALKTLVSLDRQWIPSQQGSALYLRPFMYADEAFIGMRAATRYKFIVMASPSNPVYKKRIRLYAETNYIRAAQGGTGEAKAAGNYAAAILPTEAAKAKGYDQVLWLDAQNFKAIQEVGTMNIFFKINDSLITAPTNDRILDGVTRKSIIEIAKSNGINVEERPIKVSEIIEAHENGSLQEIFGTGTAVVVLPINSFSYRAKSYKISITNSLAITLKKQLVGIQYNQLEDSFDWTVVID
jgi:branched-chain amino acid aminotransferase